MKLYGVTFSPFVRKVLFTLEALELSCEHIEVPPQSDDADFRKASPSGRIPAFADGDFLVADSAAICRYLVTRERSELMGGPSPQRQARIVAWETWGDAELGVALTAPLIERIVKPIRLGKPTDEAPVHTAIAEKLPPVYSALNTALETRGPWLIGESFSYADIAIASHMASAELADVLPEASAYPALAQWFEAVRAKPGYRLMIDATQAAIQRAKTG